MTKDQVLSRWMEGVYLEHPEFWPKDVLGITLDAWEERSTRKLFLSPKRRLSVRASHGAGKTLQAAYFTHFFLLNFAPSMVCITGPCVEENEKILLADGRWTRVKDLNGRYFGILAVEDNLALKPALAHAFPNGVRPVYRIRTRSGREALRTGNHPFRILNGWQPLLSLEIGDFVGVPLELPLSDLARVKVGWDEITSIEYVGDRMTYGIEVPGFHTYATDFLEHNTGKQTRSQVWSMISRLHEQSVFKDDLIWYRTKMALKGHEEETFAQWVSSKNARTIEGMHGPLEGENLLWIIEEAKAVDDAVYEAISGAMSHKNCFWYISSTCGASVGKFYQSHTSHREEWETEHVPYTECPRLDPESVKRWERDWGKDSAMFKARALAEFPRGEEFAVCALDWLERAVHREEDDESDTAAA